MGVSLVETAIAELAEELGLEDVDGDELMKLAFVIPAEQAEMDAGGDDCGDGPDGAGLCQRHHAAGGNLIRRLGPDAGSL